MVNKDAVRYRNKYPEKYEARKKSQYLPKNPGFVNHHWSYNQEHYKDTIRLSEKDHKKLHQYMFYDQDYMMYFDVNGNLLDTKEKHIEYAVLVKTHLSDSIGKLPKIEYTV